MEIPIQVAVQICPSFPNERCCVQTIPIYQDSNATQSNNNNNAAMGLVRISRPRSNVNAATDEDDDDDDDVNGNPPESNPNPTTFPIQHALPYGCAQEYLYQKCIQPMILNFLEGLHSLFLHLNFLDFKLILLCVFFCSRF